MWRMPTKQNLDASRKNPPIPNRNTPERPTIRMHRHGSYHRAADKKGDRCDPHNSGSRVFARRSIPPVLHYDHRPTNRTTIPRQRVPMVRTAHKDDLGPRSTVYFPLWAGTCKETGGAAES